MKKIEKQALLQYFKNCIVDDSKEELSIELDLKNSNSGKLFLPDSKNKDFSVENFIYKNEELNIFLENLKGGGIGKEKTENTLENIDNLEIEKKEYFLEKAFYEYFNKKNWDKKNGNKKNIKTLIEFIKWGNNSLRQKIISQINNYLFYIKSDKEYLKGDDLKTLFFSGDNENILEKIEFFGNDNFLNFYDKNKTEKIYICLENVITEKNKKLIFQPLYFIEIEIEEDSKEHFFTISIVESNVNFNFFVEYKGKKLFKLQNKQEKDEGFQLEKDIDGLSVFKSKIDLYKANIVKDFDIKNIKNNPCLISANDIGFIKGLLKEYQELIEKKDLSNVQDTGLGIIFNESNFETNNIYNFTNFTLLNKEQTLAVKKSLENKLSVIVGPPGTGKSQVVVNIMLNAYINNKTVLFASKNNTAVDTVLKKVSELNLSYYPFLRLGSKKAQEEWYPKIKKSLLQNIKTYYIDFQDITKFKNIILELENKIQGVEKTYLEYFESYEKLELILNDYEKGFKEFTYKVKILNINFEYIKNIKNNFLILLKNIEREEGELNLQENKIRQYLINFNYLDIVLNKIENGNIQNIDFNKIINFLGKKNLILKEKELKIKQQDNIFNIELKINSYEKYINDISSELEKIIIKSNFIDYRYIKISILKEIWGEISEAENFGFFKRLFGFKSRQIKRSRKEYYNITEEQKNIKIQNYFLDISENINDNKIFLLKIKEFIGLKGFEEKFLKFNKINKEYKIFLKNSENELKELYNDYKNYIKKLSKQLFINLNNSEYINIIEKIKNIEKLNDFIDKRNLIRINLNNLIEDKYKLIFKINQYCIDNLDGIIFDYIIGEINDNNFEEKINNLLKLEEINIQKNEITKRFNKLANLEKNITELNKEIFEIQGRLKDKSLDYLSFKVSENINDIKPQLTDSVDKIYNVFSFIKNWGDSKDSYLIEKYKKVFEGIKIFITTNLSTSSLPLEGGFYDYLIIDEASQNDIASIIPLLYRVKNVIIIGDPNQLQNIIKLKEDDIVKIFYHTLKKKNLKDKDYAEDFKDIYNFNNSVYSSFESIYKGKLNKSLVTLNEHYRCHDDIINYSNFIVGEYNLFPKIYGKNNLIKNTQIPIGIHWVLDIKTDNPEITKSNKNEAKAIIEYLKQILQVLGDKVSIGIIAPFRNQVNYINKLIRDNKMELYENILVDTVHKFQGDEKDIILFSTVFPNAKASIFLNDVNLLNVAVSRARNSFLIFGDKQAIKNYKGDNGEELLYTTLLRYTESVKKGKEIVKYKKYDTEFEKQFFEELEKAGIKFDYQYPIYEGKYNLDFRLKLKGANNYLNLELDGGVHNKQKSYDYTRNKKVEKLGYKVIRYSNSYMQANMGEIIKGLKKVCEIR